MKRFRIEWGILSLADAMTLESDVNRDDVSHQQDAASGSRIECIGNWNPVLP